MRVLIVEDDPYLAQAVRDGPRLEAIAADGNIALELHNIHSYDLAVLDRDIPGPSGDEIARRIVASGRGIPILMLTAADRIDDKASFRDGHYVALTRKQFAVLEVLVAAEGGVVSADIATVPGVGYRIDTGMDTIHPGGFDE